MIVELQAEEVHSNLVAEKKTTRAPNIQQSNQEAHPNKNLWGLKTVSLIAGPNHQFKIGEVIEETTIDQRDNTLHQIDIDNNTTNREKVIVVDIEIMIGGTKEKTDLRDGSTISMRGLKDRDTIIVTEMEVGITKILETTIEEMIHETRVMHQGLIYTNPTGKSNKPTVRLTQYQF